MRENGDCYKLGLQLKLLIKFLIKLFTSKGVLKPLNIVRQADPNCLADILKFVSKYEILESGHISKLEELKNLLERLLLNITD